MEIVITEQAEIKLREIVFYLKFEFGNVVAKSFLDKFEHHISLIKKEFTIGKKENNIYYSLLIIKQIRVYYKIIENTIYILTFFDTRQNPKKLKQILP
jgi:plasmid stabilization system protein ParE